MQGQINIPRSFYQQKNDAIVAINKDLAVPDLIPSDALIMAVSAMVIIEVCPLLFFVQYIGLMMDSASTAPLDHVPSTRKV
jgi:hypothetical protein